MSPEHINNAIGVIQDYIDVIIEEQLNLNMEYDTDWIPNYNKNQFILAATDEVGEIQDELTQFTKFFGADRKANFASALEEFIDVVHFYTTRVIMVERAGSNIALAPVPRSVPSSVNDWVIDLYRAMSDKTSASRQVLVKMLLDASYIFDITPDVLLTAYLHKNRKNHIRAKSGAMNSDVLDVKETEMSTFDFLRSNNWVSLSAEQFNAKLTTLHS